MCEHESCSHGPHNEPEVPEATEENYERPGFWSRTVARLGVLAVSYNEVALRQTELTVACPCAAGCGRCGGGAVVMVAAKSLWARIRGGQAEEPVEEHAHRPQYEEQPEAI